MEMKIERGDWQEGKVWRRAPDGHVMLDTVGYEKWVESRKPAGFVPKAGTASSSPSSTKVGAVDPP